jgi:hypothetical protein
VRRKKKNAKNKFMQLRIIWILFFGVGIVSMEIASDTVLVKIAR